MANVVSRGANFDAQLVTEIFNKVQGKSSLAKLSGQTPMPFNGTKEFTFSMDKEVDIVAENGAKANGGATMTPVTIVPLKIEYGARVSDEFMNASEEEALNILKEWTDGFARKVARGFDLMAMHGVNPRSGELAETTIGTNSFDTNENVNVVTYDSTDPEGVINDAIDAIGDYDNSGFAFSKKYAAELGKIKTNGVHDFPEFRLGGQPDSFVGTPADVNSTVSYTIEGGQEDKLILGDFENAFKWGFAKQIPLKVIEYGNPDNDASAGDLQGHNQVYLRSEAYIGWGILAPEAFTVVKTEAESE